MFFFRFKFLKEVNFIDAVLSASVYSWTVTFVVISSLAIIRHLRLTNSSRSVWRIFSMVAISEDGGEKYLSIWIFCTVELMLIFTSLFSTLALVIFNPWVLLLFNDFIIAWWWGQKSTHLIFWCSVIRQKVNQVTIFLLEGEPNFG